MIHDNLRLLFRLRNIAIAAQSLALLVAVVYLRMELPLAAMLVVIALLCSFNIYTRFRINRPATVTHREMLVQLAVDIVVLTVLLSLSGGAANPFAILYLLPLTIAAVLLPPRYTAWLAGMTVLCYSSLLFIYVPLPMSHNHTDAFNLHIVGMWLGFVLSAGVIAYFIVGLQKIIQTQAEALNRARDEAVRSEQLIKLGVLAASVAHDLGTPLNSIALLLEDIEYAEPEDTETLNKSTALIRQQVDRCRNALTTLSRSAGNVSLRGGEQMPLADYLQDQIRHWTQAHPETQIELSLSEQDAHQAVMVDEVLNLALSNIIDNAAEVSPQRITLNAACEERQWDLLIRDFGPGLTAGARERIGEKGFTTKSHGLGLGLFLSHAVIERLGGKVNLYNHEDGGLCTHIRLPLRFEQVAV